MGDDEHQRMIRIFFYLGFIKLFFALFFTPFSWHLTAIPLHIFM
jgi:hypothetical protein